MSDIDSQHDLQPPTDLKLPAELVGTAPRRLPLEFDDNIHHVSRKRTTLYLIGLGILCMVLSFIPFVQTIGIYFLPVLILFWIGLALLGAAVWVMFSKSEIKRVSNYVTDGGTGFARVDEMVKVPTVYHNGAVTHKAFVTKLTMVHPQTRKPVVCEARSRNFNAGEKLATKFRVGDWVPVVWLKDQFETSFTLYDFLEATPESSLIRNRTPLWQSAVTLSLVAAGVIGIFWSIFVLGRYSPIEFGFEDAKLPAIIGTVLGIAATIGIILSQRRKTKNIKVNNELAIASGQALELDPDKEEPLWKRIGFSLMVGFGMVLLCGMLVFACFFTVNAQLDQSKPKLAEAKITKMTETTHSLIFCEYNIEYELDGFDGKQTMMTTPDHMDTFEVATGIAKIRDGYLGWRWVETIDPIIAEKNGIHSNVLEQPDPKAKDNPPAPQAPGEAFGP